MNAQKTDGLREQWTSISSALQDSFCHEVVTNSRALSYPVDLSASFLKENKVDVFNNQQLSNYLFENHAIRHGGYLEKRSIYSKSDLYMENRDMHLGIDIWSSAHTPIHAPMDAVVHMTHNNAGFGNYGPTVILRHEINGLDFFTLYGHLTTQSLDKLQKGQNIRVGDPFAWIGEESENGNWPPHLHFQIIVEALTEENDYPGVSTMANLKYYRVACPDPNIILQFPN